MSETNSAPPPPSQPNAGIPANARFAAGFLVLMFAAGLLLVYLVDAPGPTTAARDAEPAAVAPQVAPSSGVAADGPAAPVVPAPHLNLEPGQPTALELAADARDMRERLLATQQKVQTLENDLKALQDRQTQASAEERQRRASEPAPLAQASPLDLAERPESAPPSEEPLASSEREALERDYAALQARATDAGMLVSLAESDLSFSSGGAILPSARPASLARIADFLQRYRQLTVRLQGHTDGSGDAARNLQLSEQRASAVRTALIGLGVAAERIRAEGMGETQPIATNETQTGRRQNRRVEIYLTER